jgi:hypothetical protein
VEPFDLYKSCLNPNEQKEEHQTQNINGFTQMNKKKTHQIVKRAT